MDRGNVKRVVSAALDLWWRLIRTYTKPEFVGIVKCCGSGAYFTVRTYLQIGSPFLVLGESTLTGIKYID